MSPEKHLEVARNLLAELSEEFTEPQVNRLDARIPAEKLLSAVEALRNVAWGYLSAITGLDGGEASAKLEVLYHFCSGPAVLTLRVWLPRQEAVIDGIEHYFPVSIVYERELQEMYGVRVAGLSDPRRLFLPDDWDEQIFPMLKTYQPEGQEATA